MEVRKLCIYDMGALDHDDITSPSGVANAVKGRLVSLDTDLMLRGYTLAFQGNAS